MRATSSRSTATGDQVKIRNGFSSSVEFNDMVIGRDGNPLVVLSELTGPSLVRIDRASGSLTLLARGGLLEFGGSIAVEHDGRILATDKDEIIRIDPHDGEQTVVRKFDQRVQGVAVRTDGAILARTAPKGTVPAKLVKVDPFTGAQSTISIGGFLSKGVSSGLAMEDGVSSSLPRAVPAASSGSTPSPVPISNCCARTTATPTTSVCTGSIRSRRHHLWSLSATRSAWPSSTASWT